MKRKSSKGYWWKAKSSSYESCLQRTFLHGEELALFLNTTE